MENPVDTNTLQKTIKEILEDLLTKLRVPATVEVSGDPSDHMQVSIQTEESGLLIGYHGETMNSLQVLLGVLVYKKTNVWTRIVIDVGGYRETRQVHIKEMVERIVAEVEATGREVNLPYLTPYERRIVHLLLSEHTHVYSESSGEGRERRVSIKPRPSGA